MTSYNVNVKSLEADSFATILTDELKFKHYIEDGCNMAPVYIRLAGVSICPIKMYEQVKDRDSILLHSSRVSENDGRYSIIVFNPILKFSAKGDSYKEIRGTEEVEVTGSPIERLDELFSQYKGYREEGVPPFCGGGVGYFAYECNHYFEELPSVKDDDLGIPDIFMNFYDTAVIVDHIENSVYFLATGNHYKKTLNKVLSLCRDVFDKRDSLIPSPPMEFSEHRREDFTSNFGYESYVDAINKIKDYIVAGDTFQVNLSQRLALENKIDSLTLYKQLVNVNPVHFSAYFKGEDFEIACGSPERLFSVRGGEIQARPIAGTRRRGTPEEDEQFRKELSQSEKENAEHAMLVDLDRNDLGRVCEYGTVEVASYMEIIPYKHVMHIESVVKGKLRDDVKLSDLLRAKFPGGTITGAPKVRTMEIINEFEPNTRGIYTGSIGYVGWNGDVDLNIVIRSIVCKGDSAYTQVGGGIVFDGDPHREYKETLNKAKTQLIALNQKNFNHEK